MQEIRQDLINVAFPFWQICYGQDGIDTVVPSTVDGLNVKTIQLKNAEDVSILNDALGQTNPVVPHIIRFLVEWEAVESNQVHFNIY